MWTYFCLCLWRNVTFRKRCAVSKGRKKDKWSSFSSISRFKMWCHKRYSRLSRVWGNISPHEVFFSQSVCLTEAVSSIMRNGCTPDTALHANMATVFALIKSCQLELSSAQAVWFCILELLVLMISCGFYRHLVWISICVHLLYFKTIVTGQHSEIDVNLVWLPQVYTVGKKNNLKTQKIKLHTITGY